MLNEDYKEMLQLLLNNEVKFLVVGAYAMGIYGYPRATADFDIWVENTADNSARIYKSLSQFGAPLKEINPGTFTEKGVIFQIGVAPRRIDIITHIDGVVFKESTGREKDKLDADYLKNSRKEN